MADIVLLLEPQKELTFPLMKAIENRRTKRKWRKDPLTQQDLSNILWVACGETMKATKRSKSRRTVPSGRNLQTIQVYVAIPQGLFRYDEQFHGICPIKKDDIREELTNQKMMKDMPLGLIYVSDFSKLKGYVGTDDARKFFVAGTETGFISQNVYLYCASAGLNTSVIGLVDRDRLHSIMGLAETEKVIYTQAIGRSFAE